MPNRILVTHNGHKMTMGWTAGVEGEYCWQAVCSCEEFMCEAPTLAVATGLCEDHMVEVLLND